MILVTDNVPVLGLYVKLPSDSSPTLPPSESAPATNVITLFSFVDSLSVTVTVVATAAVPEYPLEVIVPNEEPASANVIVPPSASSVIPPAESKVTVVPASSAVPSAVICMFAAAAAASVVTILNVPLVPAVKTAVSR